MGIIAFPILIVALIHFIYRCSTKNYFNRHRENQLPEKKSKNRNKKKTDETAIWPYLLKHLCTSLQHFRLHMEM